MKTTTNINDFLLGSCLFLGILGIFSNTFIGFAVLFVVILGIYQGLTGLMLFLYKPFSTRFQLYMGGILLFVSSCFLPWEYGWMLLPIPLSLYFTFMLHTINPKKL